MTIIGKYPATRMRRLRQNAWLRGFAQETELAHQNLIMPLFVHDEHKSQNISQLPNVRRLCMDDLLAQAQECVKLHIPAIALFPVIKDSFKDSTGSHALQDDNILCRAIGEIKKHHPSLGVIADVALDPFTSHGQDGVMREGVILNDATLDILCRQSLVCARAGADVIAPSDMMDGRIHAIRQTLDEHDFEHVVLLSYAAKYASSLYAPFRHAVGSATTLGGADKKSYQMNPANRREASREVALDIKEGADMVMVKPALLYLDVIHALHTRYDLPIAAYHVSGEYAMLCAAAQAGMIEYENALMESLLAIRRAGASAILTYGAMDAARILSS